MKDLALIDIFPRYPSRPTRVVVLQNGHWTFTNTNFNSGMHRDDGATYFYYSVPFGIVLGTQPNPRRLYKRGNPGDYLVYNPGGFYDILDKEEYLALFPHLRAGQGTGTPVAGFTGSTSMGY
jgi:hypothetical protein|tara:strand:+ start:79 stop:444 length:366 start_codon:yes stop_codon:yes gene_type:complete